MLSLIHLWKFQWVNENLHKKREYVPNIHENNVMENKKLEYK